MAGIKEAAQETGALKSGIAHRFRSLHRRSAFSPQDVLRAHQGFGFFLDGRDGSTPAQDFFLPAMLRGSLRVSILVPVDLRFYLDLATGHPHIWNHEVTEEEVEEVLTNQREDRPGRDGTRVAIGQTSAGRYLKVVYVRDPKPDSVFVITAFELRGKPLLAYRRRQRKKHR